MNSNGQYQIVASGLLVSWMVCHSAVAQTSDTPTLKAAFQDHFSIGTAVNRRITGGPAGRFGFSRRSPEEVERDRALVIEQFNNVPPENDLKWALIHPEEGPDGYDWGAADAFVEFGERNNMYIVGHTLVWHGQTPFWVFRGENPSPEETHEAEETDEPDGRRGRRFRRFRFTGPRASRNSFWSECAITFIRSSGAYKGRIHAWDVVNEAISDGGDELLRNSLWLQIIGPDFIAKAFEYAHEADPEAILRYNDYGLENPDKRRKLIRLIKSLQEQDVPVMAIGTQAHLNVTSASFENMDEALTEMESLGLPIHITELDINSAQRGQRNTRADITENAADTEGGLVDDADQRLAEAYEGVFRAFVKHKDTLQVVTFWGVNDANSWRSRGKPLLFDGASQPKPAFDAVIRVAKDDLSDASDQ